MLNGNKRITGIEHNRKYYCFSQFWHDPTASAIYSESYMMISANIFP